MFTPFSGQSLSQGAVYGALGIESGMVKARSWREYNIHALCVSVYVCDYLPRHRSLTTS